MKHLIPPLPKQTMPKRTLDIIDAGAEMAGAYRRERNWRLLAEAKLELAGVCISRLIEGGGASPTDLTRLQGIVSTEEHPA